MIKIIILLRNGIVKVIQISDTHLFTDDESTIFGVKSNIKFKEVISKIINEDNDVEVIILTGDLSQDESAGSYNLVTDQLSGFNIPIYWIPGNHDDLVRMEEVFQGAKNFTRKSYLSLHDWHFIFLNTKIEGRGDGYLSHIELNLLRNELVASPIYKKIAIVMHHHPAPVGTPLIDHFILKNTQEFWDIIAETRTELIICGHVHGDYGFKYNNIMIESSPATCLQWEKGTTDLKINKKIGYKIYYLDQNGYKAITKIW